MNRVRTFDIFNGFTLFKQWATRAYHALRLRMKETVFRQYGNKACLQLRVECTPDDTGDI
jgi:hypothetical protein